jgi:type I site-specific restriction endonuclease
MKLMSSYLDLKDVVLVVFIRSVHSFAYAKQMQGTKFESNQSINQSIDVAWVAQAATS